MSQVVHASRQAARSEIGKIYILVACPRLKGTSRKVIRCPVSIVCNDQPTSVPSRACSGFGFSKCVHGLITSCNPAIYKCKTHGNRSVRKLKYYPGENMSYSKRNGRAAHKYVLRRKTVSLAIMQQLVDRSSSALCLDEHANGELVREHY